jgi:hypothetical protein
MAATPVASSAPDNLDEIDFMMVSGLNAFGQSPAKDR